MRLYTLLAQLPYSLLISSLALAATAVPVEAQDSEVELRVLTPDDFDETIAKGVWFIEHFSPYCGHCRRFAPTWTQLVQTIEAEDDPGVSLAQVNCAVHGDLCNKNGVAGYPQLNLYRDGAFVDTFKKPREHDLLVEYLHDHAEHTTKPTSTPPPPAATSASKEEAVVAPPPTPAKVYNPDGKVLTLDEKTFPDAIKEGHIFVKYFAPWCGHCKKLAPTWVQLADQMRGKITVAEVDCEAHGAICRGQGVTGYPMLFYYNGDGKGSAKTEYTSGRKLDQLVAFVDKVSGPAAQELKFEDLPGAASEHAVVYVLIHPVGDTQSVSEITDASHVLFGSPPLYTSSSRAFYDHFNVQPSQAMVLAFKDHDYSAPAAVYPLPQYTKSERARNELVEWLLRNRLPTSLELDSDTFQEVMNAPHKPLVILAAAPPSELSSTASKMQEIARRWKDTKGNVKGEVVFAWMDAAKWTSWLKGMYGIKAGEGVQVVVVNHSKLVYYDSDQHGDKIRLAPNSVFGAINGAFAGTIRYKHSENIVERFARYMNDKLVSLELLVSHHPWAVTLFVIASLTAFVVFLRRIIYQESALADEMNRKARLD